MLHCVLVLADITIIADGGVDVWDVQICDGHTGASHRCNMTQRQFAVVTTLAIGIGEEKGVNIDTEEMYTVARAALVGCPEACYPIP